MKFFKKVMVALIFNIYLFDLSNILKVYALESDYQIIESGGYHSAVIKNDGSLWMWGWNKYGQIGKEISEIKTEPVKIMENIKQVSLGSTYSAVIKEDGSLWMWGENNKGQLGDGTKINKTEPVKIMENVKSVSLSYESSAAVKEDGSLWMWGYNYFGQLGSEASKNQIIPIKVMDNVRDVSLGSYHSAVIKEDGTLWMFGCNRSGELGDGTNEDRSIPVKIMDNVAKVSLGTYHSGAIKEDGSLWMWGENSLGELGDGTTADKAIPVKVMENVKSISLENNRSIAIKEDGTLWTWGYGRNNTLGYYEYYWESKPQKIMENVSDVSAVSAGDYHTMAMKEDGTIWTWGRNECGQLGDRTLIDNIEPKNITSSFNGNTILKNENYEYESNSDNKIIIKKYVGKDDIVTIPSKIDNKEVIAINDEAFKGTDIKEIILNENIMYIGKYAFSECFNLRNVAISNNLKNIDQYAFKNCNVLQSISIPSSVESIADNVFEGSKSNLKIITTKNSYGETYAKNNDIEIKLIDELKKLKINSFEANKQSPQVIGNNISLFVDAEGTGDLQYRFFIQGESGKKTELNNYSEINTYSWMPKEIGVITFYVEVMDEIGQKAEALIEGYEIKNLYEYYSLGEGIISIDKYNGEEENVIIPSSIDNKEVKAIGSSAFYNNKYVHNIVLPSSIESIGSDTFAFCTNLESIFLPNNIRDIGNGAFHGCERLKKIRLPKDLRYISTYLFSGCESLEYIIMSDNLDSIKDNAFYGCTSLKSMVIPNKVTWIGKAAFQFCTKLENIIIPESVRYIKDDRFGGNIFGGCFNLKNIYVKKNSYVQEYLLKNNIDFIQIKDLAINSFWVDKLSPQVSGTIVKLNVEASGNGTLEYKFIIKNNENGNWYKIRDFAEANTCLWYANQTGNKTLYVEVKDELGNVVRKSLDYTIKEPSINIKSFTVDEQYSQTNNSLVKLNVEASGTGSLEYKFIVKNNENGNWYKIRDFGTLNSCIWASSIKGNKTLYVDVKDSTGKVVRKAMNYTIK